jgi:hypothetical protein
MYRIGEEKGIEDEELFVVCWVGSAEALVDPVARENAMIVPTRCAWADKFKSAINHPPLSVLSNAGRDICMSGCCIFNVKL